MFEGKYVIVSPDLGTLFFNEFSSEEEEIMSRAEAVNLILSLNLSHGEYELYRLVKETL